MHEHAVMPDDVAGDTEPQEVRMQALKLGGDDADVLTALRHLYAVYALDAHRVGKGVRVGTDAADAFDQHEGLYRVALGCELFYAAVVIADKHIRVADDLALGIELRVYRLLQRGMVRAYGNYIAHYCSSFRFLSTSSLSGMTSICPLPCVSSISSGRNRRCETSSPSNSMPISSLSSRSGHEAAVS